MKAPIIEFDNNSFLVVAKQLKDNGIISLEGYAGMLRRYNIRQ